MKATYVLVIFIFLFGCKASKHNNDGNYASFYSKKTGEKYTSVRLPDGFKGNSPLGAFLIYSDSVERHNGHNVSTIKSVKPRLFATTISSILPKACIGKRIEYTAWVRSKDVTGWAGLWLRVDSIHRHKTVPPLAFDNMQNRPIKGTTDWAKYHVVLDVPQGAGNLVYGILLQGGGQVWIDSADVHIVDTTVPTTYYRKVL